MAPEIVKKIEFCGPPADIYASGVLLFAFFCGCFPFRGKDDKDLYKKIANDDLIIPDHVPANTRIILSQMLQKTPETRPSAEDLYKDAWIQGYLNQSNLKGAVRQQTRSNSIKRRNEMKPCSPSYMMGTGQKVTTPLSDLKGAT
jgi:serine/threonine protein kinase